jgi:hypothetical protein
VLNGGLLIKQLARIATPVLRALRSYGSQGTWVKGPLAVASFLMMIIMMAAGVIVKAE